MAKFVPDRPVVSERPIVEVDPGLPAGKHVFRLEVVDEMGTVSEPAQVVVAIEETSPRPFPEPVDR